MDCKLMLSSSKIFPAGGLLEKLRAESAENWERCVGHDFVRGLGNGTLPEECFRYYLAQDYLFLIHFSRAYALSAYKSETLAELKTSINACQAILEVEMGLHVEFCRGWGLSEDEMESTDEQTATMAYTRYVLECGLSGDILDLHVALSPCLLGYAEIGLALSKTKVEGNPYQPWIDMYAGEEYQRVAANFAKFVEEIVFRRGGLDRLESLNRIFTQSVRLEIAFWEQGLSLQKI